MRRPTANEPGHAHELTFSCYRGFPFLRAERTCLWLAEAIDAARCKYAFSLWAYVFMPEHVHLLLCPQRHDYEIAAILKAIKQTVGTKAIKFLRRTAPEWLDRISVKQGAETERRFWQAGGGFDRNITDPRLAMLMIEYIHANPVRRQLVQNPEEWKWSSAGWCEGKNLLKPDPIDFGGLTTYFHGEG
jgi:putative transposase